MKTLVSGADVAVLSWLGRWRFATAQLVAREARRVGRAADLPHTYRRLERLRRVGLVAAERVFVDVPRMYWVTRLGMDAAGLAGAVAKPKLSDIRHDLLTHDVAHWLATVRVPAHRLITEREVRRDETPSGRTSVPDAVYSRPLADAGRTRRAFPDLVSVNAAGDAYAHEIERTPKPHRRMVRLMLSFNSAPIYRNAIYYAHGDVLVAVRKAADEANQISADRHGRRPIRTQQWPALEGKGA
jgi:hypothetical protein